MKRLLVALLAVAPLLLLAVPAQAAATGQRRVSVVLFNFTDDTSQTVSPASAYATMFTDTKSVASYYSETSWGALNLTGDVYGWYTIPFSRNSCQYGNWAAAARAQAEAAGADLTGNVVYIWPYTSACLWGGISQVPSGAAYVNGFDDQTIIHELGHSFGVNHANAWRCTDSSGALVALSRTCTSSEYGDPFDVMGMCCSQTFMMNSTHRETLGWLAPSNIRTITTSGDYLVRPIESPTAEPVTLRVPRTTSGKQVYDWFSVEFRQPSLWDLQYGTVNDGVLLYVMNRFGTTSLVDTTPATDIFAYDEALTVGKTVTDASQRTSVSFTTVSVSTSGAVVHVQFGHGGK